MQGKITKTGEQKLKQKNMHNLTGTKLKTARWQKQLMN
jgi:hypothetical protein